MGKHRYAQERRHRVTIVLMVFSDHGFYGQKFNACDFVLLVEGKRGWFMFVMVPLAHNNIRIDTATQCYLFCYGFQP